MRKHNISKKNYKQKHHKFPNDICNNDMTYEDCELAILRHAVEKTEEIQGQKAVDSPEIKKILIIVEDFIIHKKLICYGGTAINNILPKHAQFYNRELEIPDYDFYSANALDDAKELADIYYAAGYKDVEAKSGLHMGTFKVFVNFIPIADITYMNKQLYDALLKESLLISGIHYAPPDFLRMSMYLELSRPANFNALNGDGEPEPLQGFIIVNNVNIPLSDAFNTSPYTTQDPLASFSWNASTATFDLHINLTAQLQNINFKQGAQNSIFVNLWIQDSLTSCTKGSKTANFTFYIRKGQWCNQNFDATNFDGDGNNYYDSTYSTGSSEIQRIYIQKDTIGTVNCNIYFLDSTGCGVSGCYKGTDKLQFEIINKSTTSCINANVNSYSCTNITNTDNYDGCSHELQDTKNACQFTGTCSSDKSSSVTNLSSSSVIIGKNTYQYWTCGNGTRGFTAD
jgi:hypothetical protein